MDSKTETLSLPRYEEELPRYNEYDDEEQQNFITGSSTTPEHIARYSLELGKFPWKEYTCKDYLKDKVIKIKNKGLGAKLIIDDIPIMKLRHLKYHAKTIDWEIFYTIKNPEVYTKLLFTRNNFKLRTCFTLSLTKYDGEVVEYIILKSSAVPIRWTIHPKNQPETTLVKCNHHVLGNETLKVFAHLSDEDFKIFLLALGFILEYD